MKIKRIEKEGRGYIECSSSEQVLRSERDVLDLVSACMENNTCKLLIQGEALSDAFYNLKSGVAGMALQKFINYHITTAVVIGSEDAVQGRFKELISESNLGKDFRVFRHTSEAAAWLLETDYNDISKLGMS